MSILNSRAISAIENVPGLYISDITIPTSPTSLSEYKITHVLSLTNPRTCPTISPEMGIQHLHIPIEDNPFEDVISLLEGICCWISLALSDPKSRVLVHCIQGISRSGAIIVAYLMWASRAGLCSVEQEAGLDYDAALTLARKSRSVISPNSGFVDQIRLWRELDYSIYGEGGESGRKTKKEYEDWKEGRGILMSKEQEERQRSWRERMDEVVVTLRGNNARAEDTK